MRVCPDEVKESFGAHLVAPQTTVGDEEQLFGGIFVQAWELVVLDPVVSEKILKKRKLWLDRKKECTLLSLSFCLPVRTLNRNKQKKTYFLPLGSDFARDCQTRNDILIPPLSAKFSPSVNCPSRL